MRGAKRLGRLAEMLRRPFLHGVPILLYHRVSELSPDPQLLGVTPQHFAEHLEVLREAGHVVALSRLVQALEAGYVPSRWVVITFDDGYADNLVNARPLLERYDMPATVFVTVRDAEAECEFWWDGLERLLLRPGTLRDTIRLRIGGSTHEWHLGEAAHLDESDSLHHRSWSILARRDSGPRQMLYRSLCELLRPLPPKQQREAMEQLLEQTVAEPPRRSTDRPLDPMEIVQLSQGGLVEIGAHTLSHPVLSRLSLREQRREILTSKLRLEQILGRPVHSFSYPFGGLSDYTTETVDIVREARFTSACANFPGVVTRSTDRLQLPRILVRDWSGDEFASRLRNWIR